MRPSYSLIIGLALILLGCGNEIVLSDVTKNIEVDPIPVRLSIPTAIVGRFLPETPEVLLSTGEINISEGEFQEYLDDVRSYSIGKISCLINGFSFGNSAKLDIDLSIEEFRGVTHEILDLSIQDISDNSSEIVLYQKGHTSAIESSIIRSLEQVLLDVNSFNMNMNLVGRDVVPSQEDIDFEVVFQFTITAEVQLAD